MRKNKNIKNIVFYDYNPVMLIVTDLIWKLIAISKTRQGFIENVFCREFMDFKTNKEVLAYLDQPVSHNIWNKVLSDLDGLPQKCAHFKTSETYKSTIGKYAVENKATRQLYPTYFWNPADFLMDGKKLHTTQRTDRMFDFFTTFYYNVLSPFTSDEEYVQFREAII